MLTAEFAMTDLGELHSFLGIKIERIWKEHLISLSQQSYVQQVLLKYKMSDAKSCATPMTASAKLTAEMSPNTDRERELMQLVPYRQACGSL